MAGNARTLGAAPPATGATPPTGSDAAMTALEQRFTERGGFMGTVGARLLAAARAKQKQKSALLTSAPVTTPQTTSDAFVKARAASDRVRRQARTLYGGEY